MTRIKEDFINKIYSILNLILSKKENKLLILFERYRVLEILPIVGGVIALMVALGCSLRIPAPLSLSLNRSLDCYAGGYMASSNMSCICPAFL